MHGAVRMVEEPLPRDAGLTPSWGWEAEAKGTLTGWGPAEHLWPCSASLPSPVPHDHQGHLPSSGPGFLLGEAMGAGNRYFACQGRQEAVGGTRAGLPLCGRLCVPRALQVHCTELRASRGSA